MISVKKDFITLPKKLIESRRLALILDSITTQSKHKFDSKVYRDATLESLEVLYHSKCAYCETNTSAGAAMQVDHYRPKKKVNDDLIHNGYYWLAYEWSNLILCCSKCNRKKGYSFPTSAAKITEPSLDADGFPEIEYCVADSAKLRAEEALILHPELDDVETHFVFGPNGDILGLSSQAEKTIEICDLNRKELVFKRLGILKRYVNDLQEILQEFSEGTINSDQCRESAKRVFRRLAALQDPRREYSRFGYFLFTKFDFFIANSLKDKQKDAVLKLFDLFLKKEL